MEEMKECTFRVACDVTNPLCGPIGASAVYGPQKGDLPDCRGVVVRGYDNGRGYDSSRVFGSYQADQIQSHTHGLPGAQSACAGGGRIIGVYNASDASATAGFRTSGGASGRTGSETRMKNIALNYFIKVKED